MEEVYPPFGERGIPKPQLRIRHMKIPLGLLHTGKGRDHDEQQAFGRAQSCVEYVMGARALPFYPSQPFQCFLWGAVEMYAGLAGEEGIAAEVF